MLGTTKKIYDKLVGAQFKLIELQQDKIKQLEKKLQEKESYCKRLLEVVPKN